ncbi:hypothetical protein GCM10010220_42360 [Streptomyces parvulus]|nr:hypothetical protein GCM10010220_42360 [Streptomyces parvulus]
MTSGDPRTPRFEVKRRVRYSSPEVGHPPLAKDNGIGQERTMAQTLPRTLVRTRETRRQGRRHPAVATLMALPLAVLLLLVFDGWETVATQASSVGVVLGR